LVSLFFFWFCFFCLLFLYVYFEELWKRRTWATKKGGETWRGKATWGAIRRRETLAA
jgi:hypothetical protein